MKARANEQGFSFIDVMIAVTIMLVGCVALAGALTGAILRIDESEDELLAKQLAVASMESIFSARELESMTWEAIRNGTGAPVAGVGSFLTVEHDVYTGPGMDGVVGTSDDQAGLDGILGNADDNQVIPRYRRTITITDIPDTDFTPPVNNLKQVTVRIGYRTRGFARAVDLWSMIANFNVEN